jgi:hypothetical protein
MVIAMRAGWPASRHCSVGPQPAAQAQSTSEGLFSCDFQHASVSHFIGALQLRYLVFQHELLSLPLPDLGLVRSGTSHLFSDFQL